ncbi:hypothetical protein C8C85_1686 [Flavobacterium sp. 103]|nr:hypothetical protein C8C85_1686 [Flavobacterium sp. 103]
MFITLDRILEVFWVCKQKISNPKPIFKIQIKFDEFLEKLSILKIGFSTRKQNSLIYNLYIF